MQGFGCCLQGRKYLLLTRPRVLDCWRLEGLRFRGASFADIAALRCRRSTTAVLNLASESPKALSPKPCTLAQITQSAVAFILFSLLHWSLGVRAELIVQLFNASSHHFRVSGFGVLGYPQNLNNMCAHRPFLRGTWGEIRQRP